MFEKLIDVLLEIAGFFKFAEILAEYQGGVILRWGVFHRYATPGWNFYWPFEIETAISDTNVTRVVLSSTQLVTTKDDKIVAARAMLRFRIVDMRKALLGAHDVADVTRDVTYALIEREIKQNTWETVRSVDFIDTLSKAARKAGWRYGVEVEQLAFTDLSLTKSITLNQN